MGAALMMLFIACSPAAEAPTEAVKVTKKRAKKGPRLEGEIHAGRQRNRVQPFILHQPSLDLRVQCLTHRDKLAEGGKTAPLCFKEAERDVKGTVTILRVEHLEGLRIAKALARLSASDEAAHFVVDDGGTPYQLLDLALAARRDGAYPAKELRVLSGNAKGDAKLIAALKLLYPKLTVERMALAAAKSTAPSQPLQE
jgi:hypothetical protein